MYPSVPESLVLPAVREYLSIRTEQNKPSTRMTLKLLEITRKYNYFEFGEHTFKQEGGTSIGKKHAPDTACLGAAEQLSLRKTLLSRTLFLMMSLQMMIKIDSINGS